MDSNPSDQNNQKIEQEGLMSQINLFNCAYCKKLPHVSQESQCCGELVCEKCCQELVGKECRLCKKKPFQYKPAKVVQRIIDQFQIPCPNQCGENYIFKNSIEHLYKCKQATHKCCVGDCKMTGKADELIEHLVKMHEQFIIGSCVPKKKIIPALPEKQFESRCKQGHKMDFYPQGQRNNNYMMNNNNEHNFNNRCDTCQFGYGSNQISFFYCQQCKFSRCIFCYMTSDSIIKKKCPRDNNKMEFTLNQSQVNCQKCHIDLNGYCFRCFNCNYDICLECAPKFYK